MIAEQEARGTPTRKRNWVPSAPPTPVAKRVYTGPSYTGGGGGGGGEDGEDDGSSTTSLSTSSSSLYTTAAAQQAQTDAALEEAASLCDGATPSLMTLVLPADQPLAFYAQVEAFHRRSILPHLQIQVTTEEGSHRGMYDHIQQVGTTRLDALQQWLPADSPIEKNANDEDEDEDEASIDTDFAPEDDSELLLMEPDEDEDEDEEERSDDGGEVAADAARKAILARLPGTSVAYWAAAPPGAWLF